MDKSYVFSPAERRAETVDEFLAACADEPQIAAAHLQQGYFEPWLRDRGRADLADLAAAVRRDAKPDDARAALSQFLSAAQPARAGSRRKSASGTTSSGAASSSKTSTGKASSRTTASKATSRGTASSRARSSKASSKKTSSGSAPANGTTSSRGKAATKKTTT